MPPPLIAAFESGTVALSDFHHPQHLEVALWYALHYPPAEALHRMRDGLHALLAIAGKQGAYSEGTTVRWMERIQQFLQMADREQPFAAIYADLLAAMAQDGKTPEEAREDA